MDFSDQRLEKMLEYEKSMTKYKDALDALIHADDCENIYENNMDVFVIDAEYGRTIRAALQLAQESEQLRNRLAELETLLEQANNKIQWYERTEAKED